MANVFLTMQKNSENNISEEIGSVTPTPEQLNHVYIWQMSPQQSNTC